MVTDNLSMSVRQSLSDLHFEHIKGETGSFRQLTAGRQRADFLATGLGVVVLYWLLDTLICSAFYPEYSVLELMLFDVPPSALYSRISAAVLVLLITALAYRVADAARLDRALRRSSKWFSTTLKSLGAAIVAVDKHGNVIYMNEPAQALTCWTLDRATGVGFDNVCQLFDIETGQELTSQIDQVIRHGRRIRLTGNIQLQAADGKRPEITGVASPIKDENGVVIGAVAVLHDLTDIRRVEQARLRLAKVVDQTDEMVVITDCHGCVDYVNPSFGEVTGYSAIEVIGQPIEQFRADGTSASRWRSARETLATGKSWSGRVGLLRKDGTTVQLQATASPIIDERGQLINFVIISRDVTRELALQEQAVHGQKLEAVGRMVAGLAHDFNNLLTIVRGSSELLQERLRPGDANLALAVKISEAVESAGYLTNRLLAFSRRERPMPETFAAAPVVEELREMLSRLPKQGVEFSLSTPHDVGHLSADRGQFVQALINLIVNANDAIEDAGSIVVSCAAVELPDGLQTTVPPLTSGHYFQLTVSDSGSGMDDETRRRVFEPFFTTKRVGKGTGLGLYLVHEFVRDGGGGIGIESEVGVGSTFSLYLPLVAPPARELASDAPVTIMVVDDDRQVRELTQEILVADGYQVITAGDGREALQVFDRHDGPIHLLLTDVRMPHLDGPQLVEAVNRRHPGLPVLYVTGCHECIAAAGNSQNSLGRPFLSKPFSPQLLLDRIEALIGRKVNRNAGERNSEADGS